MLNSSVDNLDPTVGWEGRGGPKGTTQGDANDDRRRGQAPVDRCANTIVHDGKSKQNDPSNDAAADAEPKAIPAAAAACLQPNRNNLESGAFRLSDLSKVVTVSPGKLGVTLVMKQEGAMIAAIKSTCAFSSLIEVGDRIVTIDGKLISGFADFTANPSRSRKLEIVKKVVWENQDAYTFFHNQRNGVAGRRALAKILAQRPPPSKKKKETPVSLLKKLGEGQLGDDTLKPIADRVEKSIDQMTPEERSKMLSSLISYNNAHDISSVVTLAGEKRQIVLVPMKKRKSKKAPSEKEFEKSESMQTFLQCWANYLAIPFEDTVSVVARFLARKFPVRYVENLEHSTDIATKLKGGLPTPDYKSWDGNESESARKFNIA